MSAVATPALDAATCWRVLDGVLDPEVPVLSVVELGIVRDVIVRDDAVEVALTPTYSGCPAAETIEAAVVQALREAGAHEVTVRMQLAPAWTTDWISADAAEKLRRYGIAPPHAAAHTAALQVLRFHPRTIVCPRCSSTRTQRLSAFGATACKSLYRCLDCLEPFEHFKPI